MDEARLFEGIVRGVLGGRRKPGRRALRYLTGGSRGSFLSNPQVLLTAAGLAWGVYETLSGQAQATGGTGGPGAPSPAQAPVPAVPPLPVVGTQASPPAGLGADVVRMIRLAVSAAHADGAISDAEQAEIASVSAAQGVDAVAAAELARPMPLAQIVAGVTEVAEKTALYTLAFALIRADAVVSGAERIYLAQLAHLLGLDADAVSRIERAASAGIDAAPES